MLPTRRASLPTQSNLQEMLETELHRLKCTLGMGYELRVESKPDIDTRLAGKVENGVITIYESEMKDAIEVLKHEFLDYAISRTIEPYMEVANKLVSIINEHCYETKEKLIERLGNLI